MNVTAKNTPAASAGYQVIKIAPPTKTTAHRLQATSGSPARVPTQCELTLGALLQRPHTSDELHAIGIYEPRSRIAQLRKAGYAVSTVLIAIVDRDGFLRKGVALYTLEGVPCMVQH